VRRRGISVAEALAISGGLSAPGKMPGHGYSLPAESCRLGSALRHLPRSVCAHCYALRGRYRFSRVARALARRLRAISHARWVEAVAALILRSGEKHFRWHDSGDLQGVWHLRKIIAVCLRCPGVRFWLPTREYQTVEAFLRRGGEVPANLCIRVLRALGGRTSSVAVWLASEHGVVFSRSGTLRGASVSGLNSWQLRTVPGLLGLLGADRGFPATVGFTSLRGKGMRFFNK
jgi:Gene product 88